MKLEKSLSKTVVLSAGLVAVSAGSAWAAGACTETSKLTRRACFHEVRDDYGTALGECANLSDGGERADCEEEAAEERGEATAECFAVYRARQEVCAAVGEAPYDPDIDPSNFMSPAQMAANPNPYLPLVPGNRWVYEGDGEVITVEVLDETREIEGVECIVVRDFVQEVDEERGDLGDPVEDTDDYFAQDVDGNVWYFGEISLNYEDGYLEDIEGSWLTGRDGAKPGIVMLADPSVGDAYRQEWLLGDAEDVGGVLDLNGSVETPAASCDGDCLVTADFTPLEPDVVEHKYYKAGIGFLFEIKPDEGETVELVEYELAR